ncbi:hypothetical protein [Tautonia marina]|uniref:hypothetical protein n=1 Tax=Tautonia marina TaxID=2653855 RepID=UPI001260F0F9|nr:hypothetical protein [Tautonia marina]
MKRSSATLQQDESMPLEGVRVARIGRSDLAALAGLRGRSDVRVQADGEREEERVWVAWEPPPDRTQRDEVVEALLPVSGVVFARIGEGGHWYRVGRRVPEFGQGPPEGIERRDWGWPLDRVLVPEAIRGTAPVPVVEPARLRLVRDDRERRATAVMVAIEALLPWVDQAPTARLRGLRGSRSGDRVLLIGDRLPPIIGLGRFWGVRVLVPIGFRPEPPLPEPMLVEAIGLQDEDLALIHPEGSVEVVPERCLSVVSRGAVRRMAGIETRMLGPDAGEGTGKGGAR